MKILRSDTDADILANIDRKVHEQISEIDVTYSIEPLGLKVLKAYRLKNPKVIPVNKSPFYILDQLVTKSGKSLPKTFMFFKPKFPDIKVFHTALDSLFFQGLVRMTKQVTDKNGNSLLPNPEMRVKRYDNYGNLIEKLTINKPKK